MSLRGHFSEGHYDPDLPLFEATSDPCANETQIRSVENTASNQSEEELYHSKKVLCDEPDTYHKVHFVIPDFQNDEHCV